MKQLIGRKMGMTQVFSDDGTLYPVTVIEVLPNVVTQVKTLEKDGYEALQVGYEEKKEHRANKAEKGIFAKANTTPKYELRELKGEEMKKFQVGDLINADLFQTGDAVDVIGTSKGHGFTGNIKRWHHKIGPKGHGSGYHRKAGSFATGGLGENRIHPGKHAAGHMGNEQSTILNLVVVGVDIEKNAILIRGAVPGPKKSIVKIRSAVKVQKGKKEIKPLVDYTKTSEN